MSWAPLAVLGGAAYLPGLWPQTAGALWALIALAWCAWIFKRRPEEPPQGIPAPVAVLALWAGAGLLWSKNPGATLHALLYFGLALLVHRAARQSGAVEPRRLMSFLILLGAVRTAELLVHGLLNRAGSEMAFWGSPNPNFVGLTATMGALAALRGVHGTPRERRAAWVMPSVVVATLFGNNMMGPLFALLLGLFVWAAVDRQKPKILWGAPLVAALLLGLFAFGPPLLLNNPDDPARLERLVIWKDTLRMIVAHPWGAGLGTFETFVREFQNLPSARVAPHAHNEFLELFFELGLPGGLALMALLSIALGRRVRSAFRTNGRPRADRSDSAVELGLLTALLAAALVDFPLRAMFPLLLTALVLAQGQSDPPTKGQRTPRFAWPAVMILLVGHSVVASLGLFHHLGKIHVTRGDYTRALPWFERATSLWPWEPHLYYDQADCLIRMNQPDEAASRLARSLRRSPRDIFNRRALAKITLSREGPGAAARIYAPILQLAPTFAPYWREMADLLLWNGDAAEAERHRARARDLVTGK